MDMIHECEGILVSNNAEAIPSRVNGQTVYVVNSPEEIKPKTRARIMDLLPYPIKFMHCLKCATVTTIQQLTVQAMIPSLRLSSSGDDERELTVELRSGDYQPEDKVGYAQTLGQAIGRLLELDGYPKQWKVILDGGIISQR